MGDEEAAGGSGGKMLLILGLFLGIAAGGGGAFVFLQSGGEEMIEAAQQEQEKKEVIREIPDVLVPLDFDRMTVPIHVYQNGRSVFLGNYFVEIRMLFTTEDAKVRTERAADLLRQSFLSAISTSNLALEGKRDQIDIEKLQKILLSRAKKVVGSDNIFDIVVIKAVRFKG